MRIENLKDKKEKRKIDILILSDTHLGTYGCRAKELHKYLKSIEPKEVILNGDIIDIWQFSKRFWPKSHTKIISQLFKWLSKGVKITYITGNHDEMLRKFVGFNVGTFSIKNKMSLKLDNKSTWIFHGDVFDVTMQHARWLTKLGAIGYDILILINQVVNAISAAMGKGRISLSKKVKNSVKSAVSFINDFETTATSIAAENGFDYVICGHIHHPAMKKCTTKKGDVMYLNSGDWIENLTSLEYHEGKWRLFHYLDSDFADNEDTDQNDYEIAMDGLSDKSAKELFGMLVQEMLIKVS